MSVKRMDHVGIVVEDLEAAIVFFLQLGLERVGEATVEGDWVDQIVGLDDVKADMAMLATPDGKSRIEVSTFRHPKSDRPAPAAPANVPGIPRITFVVDDIHDSLERLRPHGAELVREIARYEDYCLYGYVRGPEGVIIGLVEELG